MHRAGRLRLYVEDALENILLPFGGANRGQVEVERAAKALAPGTSVLRGKLILQLTACPGR